MGAQRYAPEVLGVLADWIALAMGILKFSVLNQGLCMDHLSVVSLKLCSQPNLWNKWLSAVEGERRLIGSFKAIFDFSSNFNVWSES